MNSIALGIADHWKEATNSFGFFLKHGMYRLNNLTTNAFGIYSMADTRMISSSGIEFEFFPMLK